MVAESTKFIGGGGGGGAEKGILGCVCVKHRGK